MPHLVPIIVGISCPAVFGTHMHTDRQTGRQRCHYYTGNTALKVYHYLNEQKLVTVVFSKCLSIADRD